MLRRLALLPWLAIGLCAAPPAAAAEPHPSLTREVEPAEATALVDPEGRFEAQVAARLAEAPVESEGIVQLALEFGTGTPAVCLLYAGEVDLAATLLHNSDALMPAEGPGHPRRIYTLDAAAHGELPVLVSDWIQQPEPTPGEEPARPRLLKQMITTKSGRSLYCRHDEPGYSRSFAGLFVSLASSLRWPGMDDAAVELVELSVAAMGKRRIGTRRTVQTREGDGLRAERRTAFVIARGEEGFAALDELEVEWLDRDGSLRRQLLIQTRDGEPVAQIELNRDAEGGFEARGRTQAGAIQTRPSGKEAPLSRVGLQRLLAGLASEAPAEREFHGWVPAVDTEAFLPGRVELEKPDAKGRIPARVKLGSRRRGLELRMLLDPGGVPLQTQIESGELRVRFHRVAPKAEPHG